MIAPDELIPSDLAMYLGVDASSIDEDRAEFLLGLATQECLSVADPLPDYATRIILSVAARGYSNPQGVQAETVGPYTVQRPWAGIYLTKAERAALTRGSGGSFSINPVPADASPYVSYQPAVYSPLDDPAYVGDFDSPPAS